ncbi:unnamed protein product [Clavelina lepadiformis]|uniref:Uncharacterized protein n=1 Tax=Clavelina lepadiformis TaxID=159417 RepID=A0ABP0GV13_CLALP
MAQYDLNPGKEADYTCKIIILGDKGVGKTCVIQRFTDNVFSFNQMPTITMDIKSRLLYVNGKLCKLKIWDTAGQERFRSITSNYYRGSHGVIVVYDITDKKSFEHVTRWMDNFDQLVKDDVIRLLIGNKSDLKKERMVKEHQGQKLAKEKRMLFGETSAKENINIEHVFMKLVKEIIDKVKNAIFLEFLCRVIDESVAIV